MRVLIWFVQWGCRNSPEYLRYCYALLLVCGNVGVAQKDCLNTSLCGVFAQSPGSRVGCPGKCFAKVALHSVSRLLQYTSRATIGRFVPSFLVCCLFYARPSCKSGNTNQFLAKFYFTHCYYCSWYAYFLWVASCILCCDNYHTFRPPVEAWYCNFWILLFVWEKWLITTQHISWGSLCLTIGCTVCVGSLNFETPMSIEERRRSGLHK